MAIEAACGVPHPAGRCRRSEAGTAAPIRRRSMGGRQRVRWPPASPPRGHHCSLRGGLLALLARLLVRLRLLVLGHADLLGGVDAAQRRRSGWSQQAARAAGAQATVGDWIGGTSSRQPRGRPSGAPRAGSSRSDPGGRRWCAIRSSVRDSLTPPRGSGSWGLLSPDELPDGSSFRAWSQGTTVSPDL